VQGKTVCLIDSPGMVLPSVVASRDEMVCGGVLSIHTLRHVLGPIQLLCDSVPLSAVQGVYGFHVAHTRQPFSHNRFDPSRRFLPSATRASSLDLMRRARMKLLQGASLSSLSSSSSRAGAPHPDDNNASMAVAVGGGIDKPYKAEDLLDSYCRERAMVQQNSGQPDHHRAARVLLSDYLSGRLPHWALPPH
jgi:ribosome biogenesis GTPase A